MCALSTTGNPSKKTQKSLFIYYLVDSEAMVGLPVVYYNLKCSKDTRSHRSSLRDEDVATLGRLSLVDGTTQSLSVNKKKTHVSDQLYRVGRIPEVVAYKRSE